MKKRTAAALAAGVAASVLCAGSVWGMAWALPDGRIIVDSDCGRVSICDGDVVEEKRIPSHYGDDWYSVEEDTARAVEVDEDSGRLSYDYEGEKTYTIAQEAVESDTVESFVSVHDLDQEKEYEENGISTDKSGSWLWKGKQVYLLLDEDGGIYQNGSREAEENKIYLIVKRKEDGTIREVVQVSVEDVMKEMIREDLIQSNGKE